MLPTDAGLHTGLNGPFIVLEYDEDPSLVWLENKISSLFLDEDEQIAVYVEAWAELRELALNAEDSIELIRGKMGA